MPKCWLTNFQVVTKWFNKIENKSSKIFINFDIVDFYSSITKQHVTDKINFGQTYTTISNEEVDVILHACKSVHFYKNKLWSKSRNNSNFYVAMSSFHGAKICYPVGLFLLDKIKHSNKFRNIGFSRDGGLGIIKQSSDTHLERITKDITKIFKNVSFNITIDIGVTSTTFLDVSLDLLTRKYQVYTKPNTRTICINKHSIHPSTIYKKQLSKMVENRISVASIDEEAFNSTKSTFQDTLKKANYNYVIKFCRNNKNSNRKTGNANACISIHHTSYLLRLI